MPRGKILLPLVLICSPLILAPGLHAQSIIAPPANPPTPLPTQDSGEETFQCNADCVFPWFYKGKKYNACIRLDSDAPWCSMTAKYETHSEENSGWMVCTKECPIDDTGTDHHSDFYSGFVDYSGYSDSGYMFSDSGFSGFGGGSLTQTENHHAGYPLACMEDWRTEEGEQSYDYRGTVRRDHEHRPCLAWHSPEVLAKQVSPGDPDFATWKQSGISGEHNFCRMPAQGVFNWSAPVPWCFVTVNTTDGRGEAAAAGEEGSDVVIVARVCSNVDVCEEAYDKGARCSNSDESDYRGSAAVTRFGKPCQKWTAQFPQTHDRTPSNYPDKGLGNHNFCRNPDGEVLTWCYIDDADTMDRWDYCDTGCTDNGCKHSDQRDYNGTVAEAMDGSSCDVWTAETLASAVTANSNETDSSIAKEQSVEGTNYCRNYGNKASAWCNVAGKAQRCNAHCDSRAPGRFRYPHLRAVLRVGVPSQASRPLLHGSPPFTFSLASFDPVDGSWAFGEEEPVQGGGEGEEKRMVPVEAFPGLFLDRRTGEISGTPSEARAAAELYVEAANAFGSTRAHMQLAVEPQGKTLTVDGRPCVFPFTFNNKTFSHCTSEGNRNAGVLGGQHILWCGVLARATSSFPDATDAFPTPSPGAAGEKQSGGLGGMGDGMLSPKWDEATDDWGNCLFNGAPSTTGGNALEGSLCSLPFEYKGVTYDSCTTVDEEREWCYVLSPYDGLSAARNQKWGYCLKPEESSQGATNPTLPSKIPGIGVPISSDDRGQQNNPSPPSSSDAEMGDVAADPILQTKGKASSDAWGGTGIVLALVGVAALVTLLVTCCRKRKAAAAAGGRRSGRSLGRRGKHVRLRDDRDYQGRGGFELEPLELDGESIGDEDPIQFDDLQEGPAVRIVLDDSHSSAADAEQESLESESEEESGDEEQQAS